MRINKLAAVAATALIAAAPMAMAGSFSSGTVTGINPAQGTISIDGTSYALISSAHKGAVKVGDLVAYKVNEHGIHESVYALKVEQAGAATQFAANDVSAINSVPAVIGEQKAIANGLAGEQVLPKVAPVSETAIVSGNSKDQALTNATGGRWPA